ncbi:MAG: Rrf2 family transcriptional regulator [Acidobacteriota bacterium]|nr:Rrf2 family transcriptional regulator [Acidobacteriota bacterium]
MLKLTKKADYGLIAMRHVAIAPRAAASTKEISDAYGIPLPLLSKVMQKLTKSGLLQSIAGTNGGYKLARDPGAISALEIIRSLDGPVILTSCFTSHGECDQSEKCTVREPLRQVHEAILGLFGKMTVAELSRDARRQAPVCSSPVPESHALLVL